VRRTTGDIRIYREIFDQVVGFVRFQGGDLEPLSGHALRIVDNFNLGPSLVRGFAPNGIGPRDVSPSVNYLNNPLGGTKYFGGTIEVQFPLFGLPRDLGLKGALFADAGTLYDYRGQTNFSNGNPIVPNNEYPTFTQGNTVTVGSQAATIRTSVGASLIWSSPLGPIRFDFAKALTKSPFDRTQFFRFTGGTSF
jgi:outer membrane protein insertion porin family